MKLGHGSEIKYLDTLGTLVTFTLVLEGEPTLNIYCDTADPDRVIKVSSATELGRTITTKGRFEMTTKLLEGPDGAPLGTETRVDRKTVYAYVIPRLPLLLGRLLRLPHDCN